MKTKLLCFLFGIGFFSCQLNNSDFDESHSGYFIKSIDQIKDEYEGRFEVKTLVKIRHKTVSFASYSIIDSFSKVNQLGRYRVFEKAGKLKAMAKDSIIFELNIERRDSLPLEKWNPEIVYIDSIQPELYTFIPSQNKLIKSINGKYNHEFEDKNFEIIRSKANITPLELSFVEWMKNKKTSLR